MIAEGWGCQGRRASLPVSPCECRGSSSLFVRARSPQVRLGRSPPGTPGGDHTLRLLLHPTWAALRALADAVSAAVDGWQCSGGGGIEGADEGVSHGGGSGGSGGEDGSGGSGGGDACLREDGGEYSGPRGSACTEPEAPLTDDPDDDADDSAARAWGMPTRCAARAARADIALATALARVMRTAVIDIEVPSRER